MNKDLDEALCKDFPNLYRDRNASMMSTCMCWGFPSDGWEPLIRRLSEKLEDLILAIPEETREHYKASQVKEKMGTLRFYMDSSTDEMENLINEAEAESERTCEKCGSPGSINDGPWYRVRCGSCGL